jgi:SAM-dependent methyltransferase
MVQMFTTASAARIPAEAMRELLQIDEDLTGLINEVALQYDGGVHVKHRLMQYHDFFVSHLRPGQRVLDIGCGYGAVAFSIASRAGALVVGLDQDRDNVAQAQRQFVHKDLTFVQGHAPEDVPEGSFDVIVASNVLEHVDDRAGFLRTITQRTGARRWLIRVPMSNRDWRVPLRAELGLRSFSDATHFTEYTCETFEREMNAVGFIIRYVQVNWGEIWAEVDARPVAAR